MLTPIVEEDFLSAPSRSVRYRYTTRIGIRSALLIIRYDHGQTGGKIVADIAQKRDFPMERDVILRFGSFFCVVSAANAASVAAAAETFRLSVC